MIDNYLSIGFQGQLHEALCKCISMIFAKMVYAKVAQLVECVTSNDRLFYFWESGVQVPLCTYIFSSVFYSSLLLFYFIIIYFHYFLLIIRRFLSVQFDIQTNLFSIHL